MQVKIVIVKTLAEANTSALTAAENRPATAFEGMREEFRELNKRIDGALEARKS